MCLLLFDLMLAVPNRIACIPGELAGDFEPLFPALQLAFISREAFFHGLAQLFHFFERFLTCGGIGAWHQ